MLEYTASLFAAAGRRKQENLGALFPNTPSKGQCRSLSKGLKWLMRTPTMGGSCSELALRAYGPEIHYRFLQLEKNDVSYNKYITEIKDLTC